MQITLVKHLSRYMYNPVIALYDFYIFAAPDT